MKTTVDIDSAVIEAAQKVAAQTNQSIDAVISAWAEAGRHLLDGATNRFPTFDVPPDAGKIDLSVVNQLLADEGLPSGR